ncbi:MAG: DNA polymerase III subunit delta' [Pseudomonadota bacterium]|nr:DNA polymerase III subunit delta' [Pseudomonadota bacterium]
MILGQDKAVEQFARAWERRALHHAWLLAGPKGVGKGSFARAAATRVLADAAGPAVEQPGLEVPNDHRIARLVEAGSHPDLRWLERIENPKKPGTLYRDIIVAQVRALRELFDLSPALSDWRVVVIDTVDELEKSGANALLKMLEEPPASCLFLLVSHAPGRLLPTIRSRCRRLDFQPLGTDVMAAILEQRLPEKSGAERKRIGVLGAGSAGRALALGELGLASVEEAALRIMREGDPSNGRRSDLALELGKKGAAERYAAFLEMLPALVAGEARRLQGGERERALDAYARTRELSAIASRLSLDPSATVFQLGSILAAVAAPLP